MVWRPALILLLALVGASAQKAPAVRGPLGYLSINCHPPDARLRLHANVFGAVPMVQPICTASAIFRHRSSFLASVTDSAQFEIAAATALVTCIGLWSLGRPIG